MPSRLLCDHPLHRLSVGHWLSVIAVVFAEGVQVYLGASRDLLLNFIELFGLLGVLFEALAL